jgi:hypothetical protein
VYVLYVGVHVHDLPNSYVCGRCHYDIVILRQVERELKGKAEEHRQMRQMQEEKARYQTSRLF